MSVMDWSERAACKDADPELFFAEDNLPGDWADRALCAEVDPDIFFVEKGGSTREAKMICRRCEVRAECLEFALEHDDRFGVYGGLSPKERLRLKRSERGRAA